METSPQFTLDLKASASFLRGRNFEDLAYQVGTLGAILVVLSSLLLF